MSNNESTGTQMQKEEVAKKRVKKEKKPTEQELMILQLAQAVKNLTDQIAELKKEKMEIPKTAVKVESESESEGVDEPIRVASPALNLKGGMVVVKPKSKGTKYSEAQKNRFYQFVSVPGDDSDFQPQAKRCMVILTKAAAKLGSGEQKLLSEDTAMKCLRTYQKYVSSNQDAWRVFAFYRARLIQAGHVVQMENYGADIDEITEA